MASDTKSTLKNGAVTTKDSQEHLKTAAKRAYSGEKRKSVDDAQIVELLPMVRRVARKVLTYLKPPLSFEDLVSAGTTGLVKAARDYDPSYQADFKTYAYTRIKGAILDELRNFSLLPSNVNEKVCKVMQLSQQIYRDTGTIPTDTDLAEKLSMTIDQVYETFINARARYFLSMNSLAEGVPELNGAMASRNTKTPDEQAERAELIDKLAQAIEQLPDRQRKVVLLYYRQQLTMKQISEVLEISEPRVSQIHAAAVFNLFLRLKEHGNGRE